MGKQQLPEIDWAGAYNPERGGIAVWCETTPEKDEYAHCRLGYCPTCGADRDQTQAGFLFCGISVVLHDAAGERMEQLVGPATLFSNGFHCATCGAELTAGPPPKRGPRRGPRRTRTARAAAGAAD